MSWWLFPRLSGFFSLGYTWRLINASCQVLGVASHSFHFRDVEACCRERRLYAPGCSLYPHGSWGCFWDGLPKVGDGGGAHVPPGPFPPSASTLSSQTHGPLAMCALQLTHLLPEGAGWADSNLECSMWEKPPQTLLSIHQPRKMSPITSVDEDHMCMCVCAREYVCVSLCVSHCVYA